MITIIKDATLLGESEPISIVSGSNSGQEAHSFQVVTTGSPTYVRVEILGTIDGLNYSCITHHTFSSAELEEGSTIFHLTNKPVPQIKAKIANLQGGVSPTVSVHYFKGNVST